MTRYKDFCILDRINSSAIFSFIQVMDITKVFESSVGFDSIRKWLLARCDFHHHEDRLTEYAAVLYCVRRYSTTLSFNVIVSFSLSFHALERYTLFFSFSLGARAPQWARASSFTRFLDHTRRRTTFGRTPLDEWSASRRDLYLTTQNTHDRHPCPRWDSNPQSQQASGRRPAAQTLSLQTNSTRLRLILHLIHAQKTMYNRTLSWCFSGPFDPHLAP
jgi:hypothetical protein